MSPFFVAVAYLFKYPEWSLIMGIHYDYKSTRGAKKMAKQHEREQRRRRKKSRPMPLPKTDEDKPLTLDMITDPNK